MSFIYLPTEKHWLSTDVVFHVVQNLATESRPVMDKGTASVVIQMK
jgi:hypothetical protein